MLYFAYGSNMLRERLCHPRRVPGAKRLQSGYVVGRALAFHKRSIDGSGKCDIPRSANPAERVYGVVYLVPDEQIPPLDAAEDIGSGYLRKPIEIFSETAPPITAEAYIAQQSFIDPGRSPYDWYKNLVLLGARQNGFPKAILEFIERVPAIPDPKPNRPQALEALQVLRALSDSPVTR